MSEESKVVSLKPLDAETALASGEQWKIEVGRWRALIASGALPRHIQTPEMAIALARAGKIYGWDPIRSLRSLFMNEGRIEMWAQDMLALVREKAPEATVQPIEISSERVTIRVARPPQMPDPFDVTVTREQFKHLIKPTKKGYPSPWMLYTEDMLFARCVSRIARRFFSDITAGAYTCGELAEAQQIVRQIEPKSDILEDLLITELGDPREIPIDVEHTEPDEDLSPLLEASLHDCPVCDGRGKHLDGCPESDEQ